MVITFILKMILVYCFAKWLASRGKDAKRVEEQKAKYIEELKMAVAVKESMFEDEYERNKILRKENEELKEQIRKMNIERIINGMRKEVIE